MTDQSNHPMAGRRRHKNAAAVPHMHDLPLASLLDHMGEDEMVPLAASKKRMDAKRLRSASTARKSLRGTHPNDYDLVMGVTSVGSRESVRFGEENDPETEGIPDEIVRDSVDLGETLDNDLHHDADPGVDEIERGYGSASLTECLGRLRAQTTFATCHSGGRLEGY